ncbi:16703_t:CDS:10, partial [Funneliformis geosporum]
MSFFNNKSGSGGSSWGSMIKQAVNNFESKLDKALDIGEDNSFQGEVYVDPITGFVTTIDPPIGVTRPKSPNLSTTNKQSASPTPTPNKPSPKLGPRSNSSDLFGTVLGNISASSLQNSLSSRQVQNLSQSLKSKSSDLLANIRTSRGSNDIDRNISTYVSSQTGSPRSSLQEESRLSSSQRTSLESDLNVLDDSSRKDSTSNIEVNTRDLAGKDNHSFSVSKEEQYNDNENNEIKVDIHSINSNLNVYVPSSTKEINQNENGNVYNKRSTDSSIPGNHLNSKCETDGQKESDTDSKVDESSLKEDDKEFHEKPSNEDSQVIDMVDGKTSSIAEFRESSEDFHLIIEQRERQLMNATEQNALLNDTVEKLRLQLQELEENKFEESKITKNHIEGLENQLKTANKELDMFRQQEASKEDSSIQNILELQRKLLLEKDDQISGLLSEGKKLSKNELEYRTSLKKYRAKDIEQENRLIDLQKKYDKAVSEITELSAKLKQIQEIEKKNGYNLKRIESEQEKKIQQNLKLEIDIAVAREERDKLQRLLDRTNAELKEALEINATSSSQVQAAALEKEIQINERLHHELEQLSTESENTESALRLEIRELRTTLARIEEQAGLREDNLRHEILALQQRMQIAEAAAQDVTSEEWEIERIQILRRIEDVQTQHALSVKNWERIENRLSKQLIEMETERDRFAGKYENLNNQLTEMSTTMEQQELQLIIERNQNTKLNEEITSLRARIPNLEAKIEDLVLELESYKTTHKIALQEAEEQYHRMLRQTLEEKQEEWEQKVRSEQENKLIKEHEQENRRAKLDSLRPSGDTNLGSLRSRSETHLVRNYDGGILSPVMYSPTSSTRLSSDGGSSVISSVLMIEKLNSSVRYLEGQVSTLQAQLHMATKNRDELSDELVKLTVQMEDLSIKTRRLLELELQFHELNERYQITLELLGEKTEKVEELQADIEDMKDAYRNQITELAAELEKYKVS